MFLIVPNFQNNIFISLLGKRCTLTLISNTTSSPFFFLPIYQARSVDLKILHRFCTQTYADRALVCTLCILNLKGRKMRALTLYDSVLCKMLRIRKKCFNIITIDLWFRIAYRRTRRSKWENLIILIRIDDLKGIRTKLLQITRNHV